MAVIKTNQATTMSLVYHIGQDANGRNILKRKSQRFLKSTATDQAIFDLGNLIDTLAADPLVEVNRTEASTLIEE